MAGIRRDIDVATLKKMIKKTEEKIMNLNTALARAENSLKILRIKMLESIVTEEHDGEEE